MRAHGERDLVGYAGDPPHADWPGGARVAVNFVMNYEEGSEPSFGDGEGFTETALTEIGGIDPGVAGRDLAGEGMFAYGSRAGFWRVLRLFRERGVPLTVFGCALALERNPHAVEAIREAGFDVCCHGWRWLKHYAMDEAEERAQIARAVASIEASFGERPLGWYCRYGPSVNTRRLIAEEGGFLYDSDAYDDDLPYWTQVHGRPHLVVPYSLVNNDAKFARGGFGTGEDFFAFCRDGFDFLHREGETAPKMMSVGLHLRLIGHPARAAGLERLLDHVASRPDVWVTRRIDIARQWIRRHPPAAG